MADLRCGIRMTSSTWCKLEAGHTGPCYDGVAPPPLNPPDPVPELCDPVQISISWIGTEPRSIPVCTYPYGHPLFGMVLEIQQNPLPPRQTKVEAVRPAQRPELGEAIASPRTEDVFVKCVHAMLGQWEVVNRMSEAPVSALREKIEAAKRAVAGLAKAKELAARDIVAAIYAGADSVTVIVHLGTEARTLFMDWLKSEGLEVATGYPITAMAESHDAYLISGW